MDSAQIDAPLDCALCPRLFDFRQQNRMSHPDFFNAPVPNWGDENARLLIVGLAPGMKGANRTGRPFTGDYAGDLLFETLSKAGLTSGTYGSSAEDGFSLNGVMITNAVRCVPPQNKPVGAEISTCSSFLTKTLNKFDHVNTIVCLGGISHQIVIRLHGLRQVEHKFGHGAQHELTQNRTLFDSYHCSRYNTNTNRLTADMFEQVIFAAARHAKLIA